MSTSAAAPASQVASTPAPATGAPSVAVTASAAASASIATPSASAVPSAIPSTASSASVAPDPSVAATTSAAPTGSMTPPDPGTAFLVEDFDSSMVGMVPTGWDNFVGYVKNNPQNPQGTALALVDDTRAHSGMNSMHFHGGTTPVMITRPLAQGTNKLYVRAYFYMSQQLGQNEGLNHQTLIGIRKESGGANDEVRFGEIKGVIGTNEVPSDNISPKMDQWGKGPVVPKDQWACIEVAFLGDGAVHELHAWADGVKVHSVTAGDQWQNGSMPDNWLEGKFVEVILGWHSFGGDDVDIWMDDLALSSEPIGCLD
jgi:hypothetical protein